MSQFQKLTLVAIVSGTLAGLVWFALQYFTVLPLIAKAEAYEAAAHPHPDPEWSPKDGWQRNAYTALATVLTSIGFGAILFGAAGIAGRPMNARRGALWGLAAFTSFALAPALGLPPEPPGVAVADLSSRQLWWTCTVIATLGGLALIASGPRSWLLRIGGIACLSLPHLIGAPTATGVNAVPIQLVRQFTIASLASTSVFWLVLGAIGGFSTSYLACKARASTVIPTEFDEANV
ncbi:MAG TPA: CbtA family protein [Bryobacteraceae bacterium]|nr:CbtA family protein [Bryobacteraceae bacterium]